MVVLNKKGFKLPRVEKDRFILLLRLGLEYNRERGMYSIGNFNNIEKIVDVVSRILEGDSVMFLQSCIVCGGDFSCQDCRYYDLCITRNLPFHCVCPKCLKRDKKRRENSIERQGTLDLFG